jgi:aspartate carbamoyltransferase regulatory subunit
MANGLVIDHITAGRGLKVLEHLRIDVTKERVALIMNTVSGKHGRKDIIKLENMEGVDFTVLGVLDHRATVNVIKNGVRVQKHKLSLPQTISDVIKCKNPRCVTSIEDEPHVFCLVDDTGKYRCDYCDHIVAVYEE